MRRLLLLASAVVLVDTMFYAAITPLLPELTRELHLSKAGAGVLAAAYPAGTFAGGLPGGWLAGRIGVKPTVLLGLALMNLASLGFAFGDSIAVLDTARFIQGLGGAASWAGALAWLVGASPPERRGAVIGSAMSAAIAGALLGPVVGAAAGVIGHEAVFCAVAVIGVALMAWAARTPAVARSGEGSLRALGPALRDGRIVTGMWLVCIPGLVFGTVAVLVPLRMADLGAGVAAIGAVWLVAAALEAIVSAISGRLSDRRGRLVPSLIGLAGATALLAVLPWPGTAWVIAVVIVIGFPIVGFVWAPAMAMLSDAAEARGLEQGLAFGLMNLTWAIGQGTGNAGGAKLAQLAGDEVAYLLMAAVCAVTLLVLRVRSPRLAPA